MSPPTSAANLTPDDLRAICRAMGTGGQTKLSRLLGWNPSTLWRKLNGKSRITKADAIAIKRVAK